MSRTAQDILDTLGKIQGMGYGDDTLLSAAIGKVHLLDREKRDVEEKLAYAQLDLSAAQKEAAVAKVKVEYKLAAAGGIISVFKTALEDIARDQDLGQGLMIEHAEAGYVRGAYLRCKARAKAALDTIKDRG